MRIEQNRITPVAEILAGHRVQDVRKAAHGTIENLRIIRKLCFNVMGHNTSGGWR